MAQGVKAGRGSSRARREEKSGVVDTRNIVQVVLPGKLVQDKEEDDGKFIGTGAGSDDFGWSGEDENELQPPAYQRPQTPMHYPGSPHATGPVKLETKKEDFKENGDEDREKSEPGEDEGDIIPSAELVKEKGPGPATDLPEFSFKYEKVPAGMSTIVVVTRNDGKKQQFTHPNMRAADDFIRTQQDRIKKAHEERKNQIALGTYRPLPITPLYGKGVEASKGELVITSRSSGAKVVVIPELVDSILEWLKGRQVEAHAVKEDGLALVTYPDGQKRVFQWCGGHVYQA